MEQPGHREGVTGKNLRKILYRRLTQGQDIVENALLAHVTRSPNQIDSKAMIVYPERTKRRTHRTDK